MDIEDLKKIPDVSFTDNKTLEELQTELINGWHYYYEKITGKKKVLARADPMRILMLAIANIQYQELQQTEKAGKMNYLKYAYEDYLDEVSAFKGVIRKEPECATVKVKWTLSGQRESATKIPKGSRVTPDNDVFFETTEYNEILPGETEKEIVMTCTETGTRGNGFMPGEINKLVDNVAFIAEVENTTKSDGGMETETDDQMRERAFLAPSSYSVAGPDDAYVYWAKTFSADIGDVKPITPEPGVVAICFTMEDGSIPGEDTLEKMQEYLAQRGKRPLTDHVITRAPDVVKYNINATYYISSSSADRAEQIQNDARKEMDEYIEWQCGKIGRDINPDELRVRLKNAGTKRIVLLEPEFVSIGDTEIAVIGDINLVYGGMESD